MEIATSAHMLFPHLCTRYNGERFGVLHGVETEGMFGSMLCVVCSEAIVGWNVQRRLIGGDTVEIEVRGRGRGSGSFTTVHSYTWACHIYFIDICIQLSATEGMGGCSRQASEPA